MKWRLYRLAMRVMHRFNLHYAPGRVMHGDPAWKKWHWCQWCGMRGYVVKPDGPLRTAKQEQEESCKR